jgi:hypothetical protein
MYTLDEFGNKYTFLKTYSLFLICELTSYLIFVMIILMSSLIKRVNICELLILFLELKMAL